MSPSRSSGPPSAISIDSHCLNALNKHINKEPALSIPTQSIYSSTFILVRSLQAAPQMSLLGLPGELILYILNKMNAIDALFRLSGIHERLDKHRFDPLYVRELDFTDTTWDGKISPMDELIINRVSSTVLSRINEKITKLTVEPRAIDRLLNATSYPNMISLSLTNFTKRGLCQHLTGTRTDFITHSSQKTLLENRILLELHHN